jgi:hypothetical protein
MIQNVTASVSKLKVLTMFFFLSKSPASCTFLQCQFCSLLITLAYLNLYLCPLIMLSSVNLESHHFSVKLYVPSNMCQICCQFPNITLPKLACKSHNYNFFVRIDSHLWVLNLISEYFYS